MLTDERLAALAYYLDAKLREFTQEQCKLTKRQALNFAEDVWELIEALKITPDGYVDALPDGGTAVGQGEPSFTSFKDLTEEEWAVLDESLEHVGIRKNRMTEEDEK